MNEDQFAFAHAAVAAVITYKLIVGRRNRKRVKFYEEHVRTLTEEYGKLQVALGASIDQTDYLMHVLNRNDIRMSEFDKLALQSCLTK